MSISHLFHPVSYGRLTPAHDLPDVFQNLSGSVNDPWIKTGLFNSSQISECRMLHGIVICVTFYEFLKAWRRPKAVGFEYFPYHPTYSRDFSLLATMFGLESLTTVPSKPYLLWCVYLDANPESCCAGVRIELHLLYLSGPI